jgi:protein-disulfide isomerase
MNRASKNRGPSRARAVSAKKLAQQRAAERRRRAMIASLVAGAVLVVAVIIGVAVYNTRDKAPSQFAIPKGATATGVTVGQPTAKTTIDLYIDYLCPHCKEFEDSAATALDKMVADGTAKIVYHPIAILNGASSTNYSTRAAASAGCATDAGAFDKYTKALFANQPAENGPGLSNDQLVDLGKEAGITSPDFATCVKDQRYADWVTALTETASKNGVTGTPTVLVNGEKIETPTVEALQAAVAKATTAK